MNIYQQINMSIRKTHDKKSYDILLEWKNQGQYRNTHFFPFFIFYFLLVLVVFTAYQHTREHIAPRNILKSKLYGKVY